MRTWRAWCLGKKFFRIIKENIGTKLDFWKEEELSENYGFVSRCTNQPISDDF